MSLQKSGKKTILKVAKSNENLVLEKLWLDELSDIGNIPRVLSAGKGGAWLKMTHCGDRFDPTSHSPQLLVPIVHTLRLIHAKQIAHRDVRSHNITIKDGQAFLIDFGFACSFDRATRHSGCIHNASDEVLASVVKSLDHTYTPADDLVSLARLAMLLYGGPVFQAVLEIPRHESSAEATAILAFWRACNLGAAWTVFAKLMAAAKATSYDGMIECLRAMPHVEPAADAAPKATRKRSLELTFPDTTKTRGPSKKRRVSGGTATQQPARRKKGLMTHAQSPPHPSDLH
jgi:serine/threonine protein kinase